MTKLHLEHQLTTAFDAVRQCCKVAHGLSLFIILLGRLRLLCCQLNRAGIHLPQG